MDDDTYEVSSEIYGEYNYLSKSKPLVDPRNVVSTFSFKHPGYCIQDSEGDLIVPRKNSKNVPECIEIEHSCSTSLCLVGLQIWRGSLLLADWLLHNGNMFTKNSYILELGAGVGLTTIVASMFSPVISTDVDRGDIFKIIRANIARNKQISKHPVEVLELDFMSDSLPQKLISLLPKVTMVIAADVIYDDHLTEAFIKTIRNLLLVPPQRSIYVALEKRYVFTVRDCDVVAPCYDFFMEKLNTLKDVIIEEQKIDFPQYFHYDRVKELVLLKISSKF